MSFLYKVAILIDWENIRLKVFHNHTLLKDKTSPKFSYSKNLHLLPDFFLTFLDPNETPYRIYLYVGAPEPSVTEDNFIKALRKFNEEVAKYELIALRKGKFIELKRDSSDKPIRIQKQVDMLLGLDIAELTFKRLVDRVMIFCYDTDIIPALKVARRGGLQVILPLFKNLKVPPILKEHSDFFRTKDYTEICKKLLSKNKQTLSNDL